MLKDIIKVLGGAVWLILKFILIIAMSLGGLYCLGTMFFFRFIWDGLIRLAIALACAGLIFLIVRAGRDKDDEPTEDDFRA